LRKPILIKLGGSLLGSGNSGLLRRLGQILADAASPVFILPGGGAFAELVRTYGEKLALSQESCHFMALSAMEQYAWLLREFIPGSRIVALADQPFPDWPGPQILLASSYFRQVPEEALPRTWDVTSDSIAAWLAKALGASMLVLLKSAEIEPSLTEPGVDAFFRKLLPLPCPVWFINGTRPEELERLFATGRARGLLLPPCALTEPTRCEIP
jgi:aspartokinase-like uncharacterized kinase